jgi:hypothetical protein
MSLLLRRRWLADLVAAVGGLAQWLRRRRR